jgi:membrane-associated phospholipid phosphatase
MNSLTLYFLLLRRVLSVKFLPVWIFVITSTFVLVISGLDWTYLIFTQSNDVRALLFLTDGLGYIIPFALVLGFYVLYLITKQTAYSLYAQVCIYAALLGITISSGIKAFTGRTSPPHLHGPGDISSLIDNSTQFNFGFMREQILGGWPSSHATVMFALATALYIVLPKRWYTTLLLFATATSIGIGVTLGWHWISEFVAGASLGAVIGIVVGKYFSPHSL